jgi:hypothetical protein
MSTCTSSLCFAAAVCSRQPYAKHMLMHIHSTCLLFVFAFALLSSEKPNCMRSTTEGGGTFTKTKTEIEPKPQCRC